MINETPEGKLADYLIGDLAVARRHLARVREGMFKNGIPIMVLEEISRSIEDCIERIERDISE